MPAVYSLYRLDWDSPITSNRMASLWALLIQSIMALQWSSIMLLHLTTRNHAHYLLVSSFSRWMAPKSKTENLLPTSLCYPFKSQIQTAFKPHWLVSQRTCEELLSQLLTRKSLSMNTMMVLGMQLVNLWTRNRNARSRYVSMFDNKAPDILTVPLHNSHGFFSIVEQSCIWGAGEEELMAMQTRRPKLMVVILTLQWRKLSTFFQWERSAQTNISMKVCVRITPLCSNSITFCSHHLLCWANLREEQFIWSFWTHNVSICLLWRYSW